MMRLSKAKFEQWLKENRRKIVGRSSRAEFCPLARFIKSTEPSFDIVMVGDENVTYRPSGQRVRRLKLPRWASVFVGLIDTNPRGTKISAPAALRILQESL